MNNQLWKIKKEELNKTNFFLYSNFIKQNFKIDTGNDFNKIWKWSVDNPEIFWKSIWDFTKVKGILGKLGTKIKSHTKRKHQVDLDLEEHVFLEDQQEISFDHHGKEIKMPYKMSSEIIESYPKRTLEKTDGIVRKPEITYDAAVGKLVSKLKQSVSIGRRNLVEKIDIDEIIELYVPIYEARLIGPRKNVRIMRIDGMRKKVL